MTALSLVAKELLQKIYQKMDMDMEEKVLRTNDLINVHSGTMIIVG